MRIFGGDVPPDILIGGNVPPSPRFRHPWMEIVQAHESAAASAAELSGRAETSAIRRVEGAGRRGQQERDDYIDHDQRRRRGEPPASGHAFLASGHARKGAGRKRPPRDAFSRCRSRRHDAATRPAALRGASRVALSVTCGRPVVRGRELASDK